MNTHFNTFSAPSHIFECDHPDGHDYRPYSYYRERYIVVFLRCRHCRYSSVPVAVPLRNAQPLLRQDR